MYTVTVLITLIPDLYRHLLGATVIEIWDQTDPWSTVYSDIESRCILEFLPVDLGSVNAPPPLDHRQSGVGWSKVFGV